MKTIYDWFIVVDDKEYKFHHSDDPVQPDEQGMMQVVRATRIDGKAVLLLPQPSPFETKMFRGQLYSLVPCDQITGLRVRERRADIARLDLSDHIQSNCNES